MALMAVLEADLRALSLEARRKFPAIKEAAEHAILKLRSIPDPTLLARSDDIVRIFIMACECKNVKLRIIGLACLQKWIAHGAVPVHSLPDILGTLKEHSEMNDETVQLKTLQTVLTIFQSQLHPGDEDNMSIALGICFRLLENNNPDSVHSTAAATLRQAVALIFDRVIAAEGLPASCVGSNRRTSRSNSVSGDVSRSIMSAKSVEVVVDTEIEERILATKDQMTQAARLGLRLFEDLTAIASGGPAAWLRVTSLQRTFVLDMLEYVLSNYAHIFRKLGPYQQVLRHQVCSLLMTSLRTTGEIEGEAGEPSFRRLVLRCVANVIRLYCSLLVTECEVFLNMLQKCINLELPLWHRIMVLEVLRGFCVEARILRLLFQTFDMRPENTKVVAGMVRILSNVVTNLQVPDTSEESLVAVAGMFNSKAKGVEWSMDYDASGVAVIVASEAHAITLAVEGLLGVVFTVATLTDEAIDAGELVSPRCETVQSNVPVKGGDLASLCVSMVNSVWKILLDALSLILSRCQGEAIVLEILKGYQAFTQACGVLRAVEPLNAFLASLCKFALVSQNEFEKISVGGMLSPTGKRNDNINDARDVVLTPKNVQALRTIFNIAHRLDSVLGSSWTLVLETLALLDRVIHSPHATTQEVSAVVPRFSRDLSSQSSDFNILSTLDSQLFESTAYMSTSAVCSLLTALRQVSNESLSGVTSGLGQAVSGNMPNVTTSVSVPLSMPKVFAVERMVATLVNNLHRAELIWDQIIAHFLELAEHESSQVRSIALDALDRSICAVLECDRIRSDINSNRESSDASCQPIDPSDLSPEVKQQTEASTDGKFKLDIFECKVVLPLRTLYNFGQTIEIRSGALKILLHVLERHSEKLHHSWTDTLELLRSVANTSEKDLVPLAFQSICFIMNDGLMSVPAYAIDMCIEVTGAYGAQKTDVNISLTAIGLLWTTSDFFARGVFEGNGDTTASAGTTQAHPRDQANSLGVTLAETGKTSNGVAVSSERRIDIDYKRLLLSVYDVIQGFCTDERPEVRNTAIDTLFMSITRHGYKLSPAMLDHCVWKLVFPLIDTVRHLAATSSKDEWQGRELGTEGGKPVHMLVHHSRNTAQKQWDETLVFVLNGVRRLLKHLFVLLQDLKNFKKGWDSLFEFITESILNSSKEVGSAAITTLHIVLTTHAVKGIIPPDYFEAAFAAYEAAIIGSASSQSRVTCKARQELLHNIADLYKLASSLFTLDTYVRMLSLVDALARSPFNVSDSTSTSQEGIPLVQRTVLEVLPLLMPLDDHAAAWPVFLRQIVTYLIVDFTTTVHGKESMYSASLSVNGHGAAVVLEEGQSIQNTEAQYLKSLNQYSTKQDFETNHLSKSISYSVADHPSTLTNSKFIADPVFVENVVAVLQTCYLLAPFPARLDVLPDIIAGLGRCMCTRRDLPHFTLWRVSVAAFNSMLMQDLSIISSSEPLYKSDTDLLQNGLVRPRFWKELADLYETFLVGTCGRASTVGTNSLNEDSLKADELLEQNVLDVLCNRVLKLCQNAPVEVLGRLVHVLDRCASRTSTLPLGSLQLLPAHCSRFSFVCLQALFNLSRYDESPDALPNIVVTRTVVPVLIARCDFILQQFCKDENDQGDIPLPSIRIDEVLLLLKELARLTLHPGNLTESKISVDAMGGKPQIPERAHLVALYGSLCELVITRETRIRELLLVLLRLLGAELGFSKKIFLP